jgi:hypothetical protein
VGSADRRGGAPVANGGGGVAGGPRACMGSVGSTKHGRWQLSRVRGGRRRKRSRGIGKRSIAGAVVDDDGGEVAGSIHGPERIFKQPRLSQRWPLAP